MKVCQTIAVSAIALAALGVSAASAATYVATTDFNGTQGGSTGVWTYGEIANSSFSLLPNLGPTEFGGSDPFNTPLVVDQGTHLLLHPGNQGELVDVRFTAPTTGEYLPTFTARLGDNSCDSFSCAGTDGVSFSVAGQSALLTHASYAPVTLTTVPVLLTAGQTLDFAVSPNSNFNWDTTFANIAVAAVPEPATWAILLLGFFGIGFVARGSRRKDAVAIA